MAGFNLVLASRFAEIDGQSLAVILRQWASSDYELSARFSGAFIKTIERFESALLLVVTAGVAALSWFVTARSRQFHSRIIETLRQHDEWPS